MSEPDTTAWHTNDKVWREARHEKWKALKPKLSSTTIDKKDHKYLREYFINGTDLRSEEEFTGNCTFYRMWLHPDESDEHVKREFESIESKVDYRNTWGLFKYFASNPYQTDTGLSYGKDGILFGREEQFTRIMVPDVYTPEKIIVGGKKVPSSMLGGGEFFLGFCVQGNKFLLDKREYKNDFIQFLVDFWFSTFKYAEEFYERVEVLWFFRAVYYYSEVGVDDGQEGNRHRFAERMKEALDTRDLPPILAEKWAWIKTPEGRKPGSEADKSGVFGTTKLAELR
jgi:hypothetical protein